MPTRVRRGAPPSTNGRAKLPPRQPTRWTYRRLGLAGLVLVVAGVLSAAVGFPFGSRGGANDVPLNSVAVLDPGTGKVVAKLGGGIRPKAVEVAAGSVWVANTTDRTVSHIDPATLELVRVVPVFQYPSDLAVAGSTVFVASAPLGRLVEIDAATNHPSPPRPAGGACTGVREGIAVRAGRAWLACDRSRPLVQVELSTGADKAVSGVTDAALAAVALDGGLVWVADRVADRLLAIDPATGAVRRSVAVGREPVAIAVGFGSIWVANRTDGTVSRVDGESVQTITVGDLPVDIATGNGAVWVAKASGDSVVRIDPATNEVTRRVSLHNPAAGIAAGAGRVWVSVGEE